MPSTLALTKELKLQSTTVAGLTAAATAVPDAARRAFRIWFALGWPAFLALIAIFWLMVHRPPLWG